jgi:hypothetical protein
MGEVSFDNKVYSSTFHIPTKKASAGFYSVKLDKHNIGKFDRFYPCYFHQYTFNNVINQYNFDLNHRDKLF